MAGERPAMMLPSTYPWRWNAKRRVEDEVAPMGGAVGAPVEIEEDITEAMIPSGKEEALLRSMPDRVASEHREHGGSYGYVMRKLQDRLRESLTSARDTTRNFKRDYGKMFTGR